MRNAKARMIPRRLLMIRKETIRLCVLLLVTVAVNAMANDVLSLSSSDGSTWQLFSAEGLTTAQAVSADYTPADMVDGIVPGTVFSAYVAAGREENPDWGDNIYRVDESKYNHSFWYRTQFQRPSLIDRQHAVLVFEGTNRYATVYLNGQRLGRISGHVMKARYDITPYLEDFNMLAVKIDLPAEHHIKRTDDYVNYVVPTYVASHSWDWMPYVPGLNCGITNDVYIETTGEVTLCDPWVRTTSIADNHLSARLSLQTSLQNLSGQSTEVEVKATIEPDHIVTTKTVTLQHGDSIGVTLNDVTVLSPLLWWPNGSGEQNLYTCRFDVVMGSQVIDTKTTTFGIRQYDYRKENTAMTVYVNGQKVYCKGGNWGMSDYLLRVHGKDYDTRVRLHQDMHYNMIRLWTGCVTDEAFYEACDRYGIMVWDDFWLTGMYTGLTGPDDPGEFVANARDKVVRLRNHPSVAVWCGCNEGWPYRELNQELVNIIKTYDADDRIYIANSHNGYATQQQFEAADGSGLGLSGSGWWRNFAPEDYFSSGIWGGGGDQGDKVDWGFRSELGMGAFTTWESFQEFMPEDYWWPRNEMWEKHFFSDQAEYGGGAAATHYFNTVQTGYGASTSAEQFCEKAQLMNIEVMKALYEGWQDNLWNTASGLLFWMSQSAYPSFIWQTYDYYLDTTGTYWGAKKACEPLHIQWNCSNDQVNIVNTTPGDAEGLSADIEVRRLNGQRYEPFCTTINGISASSNSVTNIYRFVSPNQNLALHRPCTASATAEDHLQPGNATDGNRTTRWSSPYFGYDDSWIYVDLGERVQIGSVVLLWENDEVYGKRYSLQVSDDATTWRTVYTENGGSGAEHVVRLSQPATGRYVKMQGIERSSIWGYSLCEFQVYAPSDGESEPLDGLYFIRLKLYDQARSLVSENFYWKTTQGARKNYTQLNTLPQADISYTVLSTVVNGDVGRLHIRVTNASDAIAFAVRVRLIDPTSGRRILPVIMEENYFTLFAGEHRDLTLEYPTGLCEGTPKVLLKQYNQCELTDAGNTDIRQPVTSRPLSSPALYDLQGRRLQSPPARGIYIENGKKRSK